MRRAGGWLLAAVLLAGWGTAGRAEEPATGGFATLEGKHPVTVELISEHASIQPGGTSRIGVHFELEDGWHIYAKEPGDAGLPTSINWSALAGASFGPLAWPAPQTFEESGDIKTFGYSGAVVLSSEVTASPALKPGDELPIRAEVKWLACKEICLPGSALLQLSLPGSASTPVASSDAELFDYTGG